MSIDATGRWWTGTEFRDVDDYLRALTSLAAELGRQTDALAHGTAAAV